LAVGLYVTCFYVGGSVGAFLPGLIWTSFGWLGAVAMAIVMQVMMAGVVGFFWTRDPARG
jgi:ABC-type spermidine/putrescine transport system permease subunit I